MNSRLTAGRHRHYRGNQLRADSPRSDPNLPRLNTAPRHAEGRRDDAATTLSTSDAPLHFRRHHVSARRARSCHALQGRKGRAARDQEVRLRLFTAPWPAIAASSIPSHPFSCAPGAARGSTRAAAAIVLSAALYTSHRGGLAHDAVWAAHLLRAAFAHAGRGSRPAPRPVPQHPAPPPDDRPPAA